MEDFRSGCPIASTLDLVGDRWTLVIVRDMLNGKQRYSEFLDGPERITTNILADRLGKMEAAGLIFRSPYQTRPRRNLYALTPKGLALHPVLREMCIWAGQHIVDRWTPPDSFMKGPG